MLGKKNCESGSKKSVKCLETYQQRTLTWFCLTWPLCLKKIPRRLILFFKCTFFYNFFLMCVMTKDRSVSLFRARLSWVWRFLSGGQWVLKLWSYLSTRFWRVRGFVCFVDTKECMIWSCPFSHVAATQSHHGSKAFHSFSRKIPRKPSERKTLEERETVLTDPWHEKEGRRYG